MEQTLNDKKNNAPEWSFSLVQAGFWMSFCVSVSFAAVYLQALGYSNAVFSGFAGEPDHVHRDRKTQIIKDFMIYYKRVLLLA